MIVVCVWFASFEFCGGALDCFWLVLIVGFGSLVALCCWLVLLGLWVLVLRRLLRCVYVFELLWCLLVLLLVA